MQPTFISFGILIMFILCRLHIMVADKLSLNTALEGYSCNDVSTTFEKENIPTVIACAALCSLTTACLSIFYQPTTGKRCVGCKVWYTDEVPDRTLSGSLYYEKQVYPDDTITKRGRTYYFLSPTAGQAFTQAVTFCEERGAQVVQAEAYDEDMFLKTFFENSTFSERIIWQGLTDVGAEGTWKWYSTGNPVAYHGWTGIEPDGGVMENCAVFDKTNNRQWADVGCFRNDTLTVCEKSVDE